jgi:hypothetical protein
VANDGPKPSSIRRRIPFTSPDGNPSPITPSLVERNRHRQFVRNFVPPTLKNKKYVEEPDELLKTNHLKMDKTPIPMSL